MRLFSDKRAVTLVEALIAVSVFSVVAVVAGALLISVVELEKKSTLQEAVFGDARIIMQQITNEIQSGTVDYEEYFSVEVLQGDAANPYLGAHYGAYGSRFFDPGMYDAADPKNGSNPENLGTECSFEGAGGCEARFTLSVDKNTGMNPFTGVNTHLYSAFCENGGGIDCNDVNNTVSELYLIDNNGEKKTILAPQLIEGDHYVLAKMEMLGSDFDQNGFMDIFSCKEEYNCFGSTESERAEIITDGIFEGFDDDYISDAASLEQRGIRLPRLGTLEVPFDADTSHFVPISPFKVKIRDLNFTINPLEDPYKAYAEDAVQMHPTVLVSMTFDLADEVKDAYPGEFQPFSLETLVSSGVIGGLETYPPTTNLEWINGLDVSSHSHVVGEDGEDEEP